jgi:hypothetical protein
MAALTRSEFYKLSQACRDYARRLALHDQQKVDRQLCLECNQFLAKLQAYDALQGPLRAIRPARLLTRGLVMTIFFVASFLVALLILPALSRGAVTFYSIAWPLLALGILLVPPSLYGTSVEQIEGKVLRVVEALQAILEKNELGVTEAVFFSIKEMLEEAHNELYQQVSLAHPGQM